MAHIVILSIYIHCHFIYITIFDFFPFFLSLSCCTSLVPLPSPSLLPSLPSSNSGLCVDRLLLTGKRKKTRFFTWEEVYVCGRYVCTTLHTSLKWLWISFLAFTMTSLFTWWLVLLTIWEIWYCTAEHIAYITSIVLPWSFWLWGLHSLSLSLLLFL